RVGAFGHEDLTRAQARAARIGDDAHAAADYARAAAEPVARLAVERLGSGGAAIVVAKVDRPPRLEAVGGRLHLAIALELGAAHPSAPRRRSAPAPGASGAAPRRAKLPTARSSVEGSSWSVALSSFSSSRQRSPKRSR